MSKEQCLRILKLLSAMEGWSFAKERTSMPDWIVEELNDVSELLSKEILK